MVPRYKQNTRISWNICQPKNVAKKETLKNEISSVQNLLQLKICEQDLKWQVGRIILKIMIALHLRDRILHDILNLSAVFPFQHPWSLESFTDIL